MISLGKYLSNWLIHICCAVSLVFRDTQIVKRCKMHPPLTIHRHPMCAEVSYGKWLLFHQKISLGLTYFFYDSSCLHTSNLVIHLHVTFGHILNGESFRKKKYPSTLPLFILTCTNLLPAGAVLLVLRILYWWWIVNLMNVDWWWIVKLMNVDWWF